MVREASLQAEKLTIISFPMSPLSPPARFPASTCRLLREIFYPKEIIYCFWQSVDLSQISTFYLCSIFDFNSSFWGFNAVVIYAKKTLNVRSSWPWTISSVPTKTNSFWTKLKSVGLCEPLLLLLKFPSFELLTTHTETNRLINGQFASAWKTVPWAKECRKKSCSKVKSMLIFVYSFISRVMRMNIEKRKRQKSGLIGKGISK